MCRYNFDDVINVVRRLAMLLAIVGLCLINSGCLTYQLWK